MLPAHRDEVRDESNGEKFGKIGVDGDERCNAMLCRSDLRVVGERIRNNERRRRVVDEEAVRMQVPKSADEARRGARRVRAEARLRKDCSLCVEGEGSAANSVVRDGQKLHLLAGIQGSRKSGEGEMVAAEINRPTRSITKVTADVTRIAVTDEGDLSEFQNLDFTRARS